MLNDFGFGSVGIGERDLLEPGRIVQLRQPPNRIDILTSISGVSFDDAWDARVPAVMDDQPVNLIGWNELLQNKRAAGRPKDLADVEKLLAVAKRNNAG